jgi:hypothetical protein
MRIANNVSGLIGIALGKGAALQHAAPRCSVSAAAFLAWVSGVALQIRFSTNRPPRRDILGGGQDEWRLWHIE